MHQLFPSVEDRDMAIKAYNAVEGGMQTLGRLPEFLAAYIARD